MNPLHSNNCCLQGKRSEAPTLRNRARPSPPIGLLWFAVLAVAATNTRVDAEVLFEEDFDDAAYLDAGIPSDTLVQEIGGWVIEDVGTPNESSTWTIANPGGRSAPSGVDGSPSSGAFLISDSGHGEPGGDAAGSGAAHDLISPPIDATEAARVWLHADVTLHFEATGHAVFEIAVSRDDGASWTLVERRVAPGRNAAPLPTQATADGFAGRWHIDLGETAAGEIVRVRLRHFETEDEGWVAIDNLLIDDVAPAEVGASDPVELLALETFDAGIPETWSVLSLASPENTGSETWHTDDKGMRYSPGFFGADRINRLEQPSITPGFVILDSDTDPAVAEDEFLHTPSIDCGCVEQVFLQFDSESVLRPGALREVLFSVNGGATFVPSPLLSLPASSETGGPAFGSYTLSVPAAGVENVLIAFHYESPGDQGWWAIDNVRLIGYDDDGDCGAPELTCEDRALSSPGFDTETDSVTLSWATLEGDTSHEVLRDEEVVATLEATSTSWTDASPPSGVPIVYALRSFAGERPTTECALEPILSRSCPGDLVCALDRRTDSIGLTWSAGAGFVADQWRVMREDSVLAILDFETTEYIDSNPPDSGRVNYSVHAVGGDVELCPDLPMECSTLVSGEAVLLFDDFNSYSDDGEVEAAGWRFVDANDPVETSTWTITNPGDRANPPSINGSPTDGGFLISDSDIGGIEGRNVPGTGMSHDVWTPTIDCSLAAAVWIHADVCVQLNDNGSSLFDLDVSADDGATWVNLFRRIGPRRFNEPVAEGDTADGYFGRLNVDASEFASGEERVRFRFRHFEPTFDWWIAIDNVQIDTIPTVGGSTEILPLTEFDNGVPQSWLEENPGELNPWDAFDRYMLADAGTVFLHHFLDGGFMSSAAERGQDTSFITPRLDLSGEQAVWLHFKSATQMSSQISRAQVSIDDGATWLEPPVFSYDLNSLHDPLEAPYYESHVIPVPEAADQPLVRFRWQFLNTGAPQGWWAVDDIRVTAGLADEPPPPVDTFVRGDADSNNQVNLNDGIVTLNFLFLAGPMPACLDAADTDDNGMIILNDAVALFNWLFLAGTPPTEPTPSTGTYPADDCGRDPTPDGLECATRPQTCM